RRTTSHVRHGVASQVKTERARTMHDHRSARIASQDEWEAALRPFRAGRDPLSPRPELGPDRSSTRYYRQAFGSSRNQSAPGDGADPLAADWHRDYGSRRRYHRPDVIGGEPADRRNDVRRPVRWPVCFMLGCGALAGVVLVIWSTKYASNSRMAARTI